MNLDELLHALANYDKNPKLAELILRSVKLSREQGHLEALKECLAMTEYLSIPHHNTAVIEIRHKIQTRIDEMKNED